MSIRTAALTMCLLASLPAVGAAAQPRPAPHSPDAQGSSHKEIAQTLGLKTASIKLLLFRARRRLAALLREGGR